MKEQIIVAYKFDSEYISVEVVKQTNLGYLPIYQYSAINLYSNPSYLNNFIYRTKNEIQELIKAKITNVVIVIKNSINYQISKKIISKENDVINKLSNEDLAKKLYYLEKENGYYLFGYEIFSKIDDRKLISLSLLNWKEAKMIFSLMKQNNLNVIRMYDNDFLENISNGNNFKNGVATFLKLTNQHLKIEISKNYVNFLELKLDFGLNYLINNLQNKLNLSESEAKIKLNLWANNLHADNELEIESIVKDYLSLISNVIIENANKLNINKDNIQLNISQEFNMFKKVLLNDEDLKMFYGKLIEAKKSFISYEMLGLLNLIDNQYTNTIKEMTITSELFVVDTEQFSNYSFNYKK
ncbi:hypothetical protein [Mycoplasma enhydrae]|uniref:hypothetical protein n=1 Tax=Mycoplasma enhydrae TaxID=2499220 RepID=UPI00197C5D6F|nr:hypothetical protein [Mycoplasma enhydrae]MBN4089183.1 hypothetical protein [Mycoplasma enhydrae]